MKSTMQLIFTLTVLSGLFLNSSHAVQVFIEEDAWDRSVVFSDLMNNGVKMLAISKAIQKCKKANMGFCELKHSHAEKLNQLEIVKESGVHKYQTKIIAYVHGHGPMLAPEPKRFQGNSSWSGGAEFNQLENQGVKYQALSAALNICYMENLHCFVTDLEFSKENVFEEQKFNTDANATVVGYMPIQG